ncbi:MAG: cell division protein FtsA [Hyphomicrobiales bacterium]|nr:cell division protein FtsA [Hyphomicrobiales bacterium]
MTAIQPPPRLKSLSPRRSATISVLDIGTSKVVCLVAKLVPAPPSETLRGRTHQVRVLGIGHQRARGLKGGAVVDMDEAEAAIRQAVDAAERMANVQVEGVIVNITGGRLAAQSFHAETAVSGHAVAESDLQRVLEAATSYSGAPNRAVLHSLPSGFALDAAPDIRDPRGMIGEKLAADLTVVSTDASCLRNLLLAVERCHLSVEAVIATPYAAGLSVLVDDEAELGTALIDLGAGTTSMGVFRHGRLVHVDAIAVGGHHVTLDVARGLNTRIVHAERLKTLHGSTLLAPSDERESIDVVHVGDEDHEPTPLPRALLTNIITPRVEEILELVRDRLKSAGFADHAGRRLVLVGGAAQLTGLVDTARRILSPQVRLGRPLGVQGLPESARSPAFAAAMGLAIYPQVAGIEHFEPRRHAHLGATGTDGYVARVGRWLKESF